MLRVDPAKTHVVDGRGRSISTAILYDVVSELRVLSPGETVTLRTDRLAAVDSDVRAWCRTTGHQLVEVGEADDVLAYAIRKAAGCHEQPGWALVISEPGLEELLSPLGFALAAALGGSSVAIYFQGPAVRVLKRSFSERLHGWQRPFSVFARRGLERAGHPPPHEKLRQLNDLGARIYACGGSMDHFRVAPDELLQGVRIATYPTFVEEMNAAGVQVFLQ
jgi:predicted peroxiredoxin/TusA-related sulfurtransferase